jgi:hypothetical protein
MSPPAGRVAANPVVTPALTRAIVPGRGWPDPGGSVVVFRSGSGYPGVSADAALALQVLIRPVSWAHMAISTRLVRPRATGFRISSSRLVSGSMGCAGGPVWESAKAARSRAVMFGAIKASPRVGGVDGSGQQRKAGIFE